MKLSKLIAELQKIAETYPDAVAITGQEFFNSDYMIVTEVRFDKGTEEVVLIADKEY